MKKEELDRLASLLTKKHFPLKIEWLKICVDYLEHSLGTKMSTSYDIFNLVVDQFLNSTLSETFNPLMKIPTNAVKVVIVKRMVFQMISYTNISVSLYEQLSECTRHDDNLAWFHGGSKTDHDEENREKEKDSIFQPVDKNNNSDKRTIFKKRGMLKMELTDGVNTVKAIELEEIFNEELLVPGVKILLTGKVKCRRGTLLLEKANCAFLGGRIESMKVDKVKQLSTALNIDLDAEKKRRQESLEKAAASVSSRRLKNQIDRKNNTSLNQSSISPFLVKTNRKTGEVMNTPSAPPAPLASSTISRPSNPVAEAEVLENLDLSIEEILPPQQEPTPEPPEHHDIDPIEIQFTWNQEKPQKQTEKTKPAPPPPPTKRLSSLVIDKKLIQNEKKAGGEPALKPIKSSMMKHPKQREENNKTIESWAFNSTSSFEKPQSRPKVKQLPEQLLQSLPNSKEQPPNTHRPTLGSPSMSAEKRKEISKWVWDDRKGGSEEEEIIMAQRKKSDSVMELPQCFLKVKSERQVEDQQLERRNFIRTIHGPRKVVEDFRVKQKSPDIRITEHFPIVKSRTSSVKTAESSVNNHSIREIIEQEDEEEFEDVDDIIAVSPYPLPDYQPHQPLENPQLEHFDNEHDDSILECTIEQEGRFECERWGLSGRSRKRASEKDAWKNEFNEHSMKMRAEEQNYKMMVPPLSVPTVKSQDIDNNFASKASQMHPPYPGFPSQSAASPQNWNFPDPHRHKLSTSLPLTPPSRTVKTERTENQDERRMMTMMRIPPKKPACSQDDVEEIKNKQSANVQIYRTPFAKRLPSTDSSTTVTSQLFQRMSDLQIVPLADALQNRKFWMMSKIIVVMPSICHQLHELKSDGVDWLLQMSVTDTSASNIKCRVATSLLNRIFGFNVQQCKNLFNLNQVEELRIKKYEAERKLLGFKRLDLLIWIEVSPDLEKLPLILDVKTISDALNIL